MKNCSGCGARVGDNWTDCAVCQHRLERPGDVDATEKARRIAEAEAKITAAYARRDAMTKTQKQIDAEKAGKSRPDLIPVRALLGAGQAMAYGRNKHGNCTWRAHGTEQSTIECHAASAERHLLEYRANRDAVEAGSGLPVLYHLLCQVAIMIDLHEDPPQALDEPTAEAERCGKMWDRRQCIEDDGHVGGHAYAGVPEQPADPRVRCPAYDQSGERCLKDEQHEGDHMGRIRNWTNDQAWRGCP